MSFHRNVGIGALVALVIVTNCSEPPSPEKISSGKIIDKRYEPQGEYSKLETDYSLFPDFILTLNKDYIDDEDYIITLGNVNGKYITRTVYVKKNIYDSLKIGDLFNASSIPFEDSDPDRPK